MIASVHSKRGDYEAARDNIELALSFDKRVENSIGIAKDLFARGMIEEKAGDDEQAYRSFEKSFQVYQAMYLYKSAAAVLPHLISAAERLEKDEEAARYRELQKQFQGS
jgi:tetratricopeptide (TPR) repeat protein